MIDFHQYLKMRESTQPHDMGDEVVIAVGPFKGQTGTIEKYMPNGMYQVMVSGGEIISMLGADLIPGDQYEFDWSAKKKNNFLSRGRKPMNPYRQFPSGN